MAVDFPAKLAKLKQTLSSSTSRIEREYHRAAAKAGSADWCVKLWWVSCGNGGLHFGFADSLRGLPRSEGRMKYLRMYCDKDGFASAAVQRQKNCSICPVFL